MIVYHQTYPHLFQSIKSIQTHNPSPHPKRNKKQMSAIHTVNHLMHCQNLDVERKITCSDDEGWLQMSKLFVQMTCTQLKHVAKFKVQKYWSVYLEDSMGTTTEMFLNAGMPNRKIMPIFEDLMDVPKTEDEIYESSPHAILGESLNDILCDYRGIDCKNISSVWLDYRFRFEGHLDQFPVIHIGQLLRWYLGVDSLMFMSFSTVNSDVNQDNIIETMNELFDNRDINPHAFSFIHEQTFILPSRKFFVVVLRLQV